MKIVYIYHSLAIKGGLERVIVDKANYLAEKLGYDIYIITTDQGSNPIVYPLYKTVTHIDLGIFIYRIYNYSRLKRIKVYWGLKQKYKKTYKVTYFTTSRYNNNNNNQFNKLFIINK